MNRVFAGVQNDYLVWKNSGSDAATLIWEAKTQGVKLSIFAEELFRKLRDRTGMGMLRTKGEFHRLMESADLNGVPKEVEDKLDLIADLFQRAAPTTNVPMGNEEL